jgi:hypothetical protein
MEDLASMLVKEEPCSGHQMVTMPVEAFQLLVDLGN